MKQTEETRLYTLNLVLENIITIREAAIVLGLSERHTWRILAEYRKEGVSAIAHGNRGKTPSNSTSEEVKSRIVTLARTKYAGFNHSHFTEKLAEQENIRLSRSTVRNILKNAGLNSHRRHQMRKYRSRRPRMPHEGMLLQLDGSHHDWLEGRGPCMALILAVDDATGTVPYALFREQEDTSGYFMLIKGIVKRRGIPMAIHTDRHAVFDTDRAKNLPDNPNRRQTQFSRALRQLGISLILARSPQAKGRVERMAGTFQDRLISELRLANAVTIEDANHFLNEFLPQYNRRFGVPPRHLAPAYRPLPDNMDLSAIACYHHSRKVANDNTVRYKWRILQLLPDPIQRSYAGLRVELREHLDGELQVLYKNKIVKTREAPTRRGYFNTSDQKLFGSHFESIPAWLDRILNQTVPGQPVITTSPFIKHPTPRQQARWDAVQGAIGRGLSIRSAAKLLGMSRKTIRKYRLSPGPLIYGTGRLLNMSSK